MIWWLCPGEGPGGRNPWSCEGSGVLGKEGYRCPNCGRELVAVKCGGTAPELLPGQDGRAPIPRPPLLFEMAIPSGRSTPGEVCQRDQTIHVTEGVATLHLAAEVMRLPRGDVIRVEAGVEHRISNAGPGLLRLLVMQTPPRAVPYYQHPVTS